MKTHIKEILFIVMVIQALYFKLQTILGKSFLDSTSWLKLSVMSFSWHPRNYFACFLQ